MTKPTQVGDRDFYALRRGKVEYQPNQRQTVRSNLDKWQSKAIAKAAPTEARIPLASNWTVEPLSLIPKPVPPVGPEKPVQSGISRLTGIREKVAEYSERTLAAKTPKQFRKAYRQLRHNERKLDMAARSLANGGTLEVETSDIFARLETYGKPRSGKAPFRVPKFLCVDCRLVQSERVGKRMLKLPANGRFCSACESPSIVPISCA